MIQLQALCVQMGDCKLNVSLRVPSQRYAVLMGKTGSGKTTLLETICGLHQQQSGQIIIDDQNVSNVPPPNRGIGYVPQDLALFPSLSVREHLGFALQIRRRSGRCIEQRVNQLANELQIENLLDRKTGKLSGGEKQRVALGRALAFQPSVLLLDEPLSALDGETRSEMIKILGRLKGTGATILHVTHSTSEASSLADHHFRLTDGVACEELDHD